MLNGPITLAGLLDILPDDVGLEEVFIDPSTEYESSEVELIVRKAVLKPNAEVKLQKYREAMAGWEVAMAQHERDVLEWVRQAPAARQQESVEAKRAELEQLDKRKKELDDELRRSESAAWKETS